MAQMELVNFVKGLPLFRYNEEWTFLRATHFGSAWHVLKPYFDKTNFLLATKPSDCRRYM